jgi:hypothetical protein
VTDKPVGERKPTYTGSPINRGIGQPRGGSVFRGRRGAITLLVAAALLAGFAWVGLHDNADAKAAPGVGSCVRIAASSGNPNDQGPAARKVSCSDRSAQYTVLAKIVGGDQQSCASVNGTVDALEADEVDPAQDTEHPAYVLCLGAH